MDFPKTDEFVNELNRLRMYSKLLENLVRLVGVDTIRDLIKSSNPAIPKTEDDFEAFVEDMLGGY